MGRHNTIARETIRDLCYSYRMDEKEVFERATILLKAYRKLCYSSFLDGDDIEVFESERDAAEEAIRILENIDPKDDGQSFTRSIRDSNVNSWILRAVESAMIKVQEFPQNGNLYFQILNKCFIIQVAYSESEISATLCLERSRYYDNRREATIVFGLCLWGSILPKMKRELNM